MTALDIAQYGVLGHRHQLERMPPLQPQRMQRRAPGQPVKMLAEPIRQRQAAGLDADQAFAFLDTVGGDTGLFGPHAFTHFAQPRNAAMFAA